MIDCLLVWVDDRGYDEFEDLRFFYFVLAAKLVQFANDHVKVFAA